VTHSYFDALLEDDLQADTWLMFALTSFKEVYFASF